VYKIIQNGQRLLFYNFGRHDARSGGKKAEWHDISNFYLHYAIAVIGIKHKNI